MLNRSFSVRYSGEFNLPESYRFVYFLDCFMLFESQ